MQKLQINHLRQVSSRSLNRRKHQKQPHPQPDSEKVVRTKSGQRQETSFVWTVHLHRVQNTQTVALYHHQLQQQGVLAWLKHQQVDLRNRRHLYAEKESSLPREIHHF